MGAGICAVKILLGEDGQFLPPPHPPSTHFHQSQSQSQSYDQDDATTRCQKPLNASIRSPTSGNDGDTALSRGKLRHLGVLHKQKGVRPWQYAVFLEIFVHTLASRLGNEATAEVMEAWVQILAYSLQGLLPTAIDGLVQDSEAYAVSQCDAVGNTRRQTVRVVEENSSGEAVVTSRTSIEQPPSTSTTNTTPHVPPPTPLQQDCDQKKDKHEEEEPSIQSGEIPSSTTSSVIGAGEGTPLVVTDV
eukprot:scaffold3143_cov169-Ochromonas_danica.AAC.4